MEGLKSVHAELRDLYQRAKKLISTSLALATLFTEEANRLKREDEASRLRALYFSIRRQLDWERNNEASTSYAHSQADLKLSVGGLVVGGILKLVSHNQVLSAISDSLLRGPGDEQPAFGTVIIYIGPGGLPDDVQVAPISKLARELNRPESEVIDRLREGGYLLLSEKDFSLLIDRIIDDVREGRLLLPVSREKLSEIAALSLMMLQTENSQ